jgi:hypothetical protein
VIQEPEKCRHDKIKFWCCQCRYGESVKKDKADRAVVEREKDIATKIERLPIRQKLQDGFFNQDEYYG